MSIYPQLISSDVNLNDTSELGYNYFVIDCKNGNINIDLPVVTGDAQTLTIIRNDSSLNINTLTLTPYTEQPINNGTTLQILNNQQTTLCSFNYNLGWLAPVIAYTL
jgi:hypothetical protein